MLAIMIMNVGMCDGKCGRVAEDSDTLWAMHKGVEAELMIGALMIQGAVTALREKMNDPNQPVTAGEIYNTAGRYMRMCDALQQATLEGLQQKENCWCCAKQRRECK